MTNLSSLLSIAIADRLAVVGAKKFHQVFFFNNGVLVVFSQLHPGDIPLFPWVLYTKRARERDKSKGIHAWGPSLTFYFVFMSFHRLVSIVTKNCGTILELGSKHTAR